MSDETVRLALPPARFRRAVRTPALMPTARLLTDGGDARIVCDANGANRYGCSPRPEPDVLAFGSATASTISGAGFAAADALRDQLNLFLGLEDPAVTYQREIDRLRPELAALCGVDDIEGLDIIFGASGTDLHLFASQFMVDRGAAAPLIVRVEAAETGRGVPDALAGRHFSDCAALGDLVVPSVPLDCGRPLEIFEISCRAADGALRPAAAIDQEVEEAVARAVAAGRRVLLTLVDVSKTGSIAPSPDCAAALRARFGDALDVLVDACQFRLAPATLCAYLARDFAVAITGSKFITGPTFCGALLVPAAVARRWRTHDLPPALKSYSARADWPRDWAARAALNAVPNFGLLLRWEAALSELRAFRKLPEEDVYNFVDAFGAAILSRLESDAAFEVLPTPGLARGTFAAGESWDQLPTIFSFLLRRPETSGRAVWLTPSETRQVHELLREDLRWRAEGPNAGILAPRCQLGQPVACGLRDGAPVGALRLCLSSRLIADAISPRGRGPEAVLIDALAALDKAALLAAGPPD
ncbi:MAG: hypothetical protein WDO13_21280 [Verrucomicrobiota bacterium]